MFNLNFVFGNSYFQANPAEELAETEVSVVPAATEHKEHCCCPPHESDLSGLKE